MVSLHPDCMPKDTVVLYHAHCPDGFCAAWVARLALGGSTITKSLSHDPMPVNTKVYPKSVEYIPINYGDPIPDVSGKDVYILDFSFKRPILEEMKTKANRLVVLDHHKTAQAELEGLDYCKFDMTKSGARMTWEYFFPKASIPEVILYVEDRDLWNWNLESSKEFNSGLDLLDRDFVVWDQTFIISVRSAIKNIEYVDSYNNNDLIKTGTNILKYKETIIQSAIKYPERIILDGYDVPCLNTTTLHSEIGNRLAQNEQFAVTWFYDGPSKTYKYSLRSSEDGLDVSTICRKFGGGGHKHAAGFTSSEKL